MKRITFFWLLLAVTSPALGQKKERARKEYERGAELMAQGQFRDAIEAFENSYLAVPHPATLYNLAQCHEEVGERDKAIEYYRRVVKDIENEVLRQKAQDGLRRLHASESDEEPEVEATPPSRPEPQPTKVHKEPAQVHESERPRRERPPVHLPEPLASRGWRASFAPGLFFPTGKTGDLLGLGFDIGTKVEYEWLFSFFGIGPQFGFEFAHLGPSDEIEDGDADLSANMISSYVGPRAAFHLGRIVPWVAFHMGFYHYGVSDVEANGAQVSCPTAIQAAGQQQGVNVDRDDAEEFCSDSAFGINVGSGLDVLIVRRFAASIGFAYHVGFVGDAGDLEREMAGVSLLFAGTFYGP